VRIPRWAYIVLAEMSALVLTAPEALTASATSPSLSVGPPSPISTGTTGPTYPIPSGSSARGKIGDLEYGFGPAPGAATIPTTTASPVPYAYFPAPSSAPAPPAGGVVPAVSTPGNASAVSIVNDPIASYAYWVALTDGTIDTFLAGVAYPGTPIAGLASPISDMGPQNNGAGLWMTTANGVVYPVGTAGYYGQAATYNPAAQIVAIVPTTDGGGYWQVGADGGVFSFGDAPYYGSLPGLGVNVDDVVGATQYANGYCMVEADGYYACFYSGGSGRAQINPSGPFNVLVDPATTIAVDYGASCLGLPACGGWITNRTGQVYTYGYLATYEGGLGSTPNGPILGSSGTGATGYRLIGADGGVFSFNMPFEGNVSVSSELGSSYAQQVGQVMLPEGGWGTFNEWSNGLQPIWQHESGWRWNVCGGYPNGPYYPNCPYTTNAYGIPQLLPGSKMCTEGPACPNPTAWQTDAWTQIIAGFWYIGVNPNRECCPLFYDPATAWQYWQTHGNYGPVQ
jgi:hypothetical protein